MLRDLTENKRENACVYKKENKAMIAWAWVSFFALYLIVRQSLSPRQKWLLIGRLTTSECPSCRGFTHVVMSARDLISGLYGCTASTLPIETSL